MRTRLLAVGLAIIGLLSAGVAAAAVWRRMGREASAIQHEPIRPPAISAPPPRQLPSDLEPHPTGIFAALGRFDYRFRRVLPVIGLAAVIGLNIWANQAGGTLIQGGWVIEGSEEQQAAERLADRFGEQATTMLVVYGDPQGDAARREFQEEVTESLEPIEDDPLVDEITTYADSPIDELLSQDGSKTLAVITLSENEEDAVEGAAELTEQIEAPDGADVLVTGIPQLYHEFNGEIEEDLVQAELISLPIALLILLAVFGTLVGAVLPLIIAGLALPSAFAIVNLLAGVTDVSVFVTNLASMIGLALAIDYSLFMVSRYREELRHHSVEVAIERMMGSVGKAVAVSGVAVAIGLSSLTVFEAAALRSMGVGGVITVVSTLLFALTVLPALMALLGPRVNRLRIPLPGPLRLVEDDTSRADARQGHGIWAWIAARVMRRPILIALPVLALLLLAGSPFLSIELSTGQNLEDLPETPAREAFLLIEEEFPGGESDPIVVALTYDDAVPADDGLSLEQQDELGAYVAQLEDLDDVSRVESVLDPPPGMPEEQYSALLAMPADERPAEVREGLATYLSDWVGEDTTKLRVASPLLPDSDASRNLVERVRAVQPPEGSEALTGGLPSRSHDFMASFYQSVPAAVLIVVAVTGAVLFLTFGSIFLPLKAVLMSLISVSASFGALVWIFQQGHFSDLLGFTPSGTIAAWLPILMFAILFGLSMDYEVFLLSRVRERYLVHGDNTRAVAEGIGITGGIITGAALIMVAVFAAFSLSGIVFLKAIGFSMALAVLIDATIVRGILVPAFMRVMGSVNWWAPRWVQRLVARLGLYEGPADVHRREPATA
ncbi:MAG TPA: MMPL family transporter [Candidatus Limnocylindria bacterium]|nr:MMPL family transporter [Candidatus Limnocylindria bacterium]